MAAVLTMSVAGKDLTPAISTRRDGKTVAWDENARLCKVGRVRVKFDPPLSAVTAFQQELKLRDGMIHITSETCDAELKLRIRVDANHPLVRIDAESGAEVSCRAEVELWRTCERPCGPGDDSHSGNGVGQLAGKPTVLPDVVVDASAPGVVWYHRNTRSLYEAVLKTENLAGLKGKFPDPLLNHTNNGIELTAMLLEYYNHTRDEEFIRQTLVPVADPLIAFFELSWPKRDSNGKILFDPSQALETFQTATNPLPDIAGLHYVLPRLLALPEKTTTQDQRARWQRMLKLLPPIPVAEADGKKVLCPAAVHGGAANCENPELYAVFPYKDGKDPRDGSPIRSGHPARRETGRLVSSKAGSTTPGARNARASS